MTVQLPLCLRLVPAPLHNPSVKRHLREAPFHTKRHLREAPVHASQSSISTRAILYIDALLIIIILVIERFQLRACSLIPMPPTQLLQHNGAAAAPDDTSRAINSSTGVVASSLRRAGITKPAWHAERSVVNRLRMAFALYTGGGGVTPRLSVGDVVVQRCGFMTQLYPDRAHPGVVVRTFDEPLRDVGDDATSTVAMPDYGAHVDVLVAFRKDNGAVAVTAFDSRRLERIEPTTDDDDQQPSSQDVEQIKSMARAYCGGAAGDTWTTTPPLFSRGDIVRLKRELLDPCSAEASAVECSTTTTSIVIDMLPSPGIVTNALYADMKVLRISANSGNVMELHVDSGLYVTVPPAAAATDDGAT